MVRGRPWVTGRPVVGVGMASRATAADVATLVIETLRRHHLPARPGLVATRAAFVGDRRLDLGCRIVGFGDDVLIGHSRPVERAVGLAARVAETSALLAAGDGSRLVGPVRRRGLVTVAVALGPAVVAPRG